MNKRLFIIISLAAIVFVTVPAVLAQTAESDIPEKLLPLAQELGCNTQASCEATFNANFTKGLELAEKHGVYTAAQKQVAQSFKSEVLGKLQNITEENFEEELVKIAEAVLSKPTLARRLNVTRGEVQAAKTIVTEVKNVGVSLNICRQSEESLTREQLIACLKASKELAVKAEIVETYIPRQRIEQIDFSSKMAELEAALANGEYLELGRTSDEAGFNCLKSGSEAFKSCDVIAEKYFGPEGIAELKQARSQIVQTEDYYKKGIENISLVTPDGRTVVGKAAIMGTCDQAFQTRNVTLARTCGDFAVKNGFASQAEVEEGIKFFESTARANVDFRECARNPRACEQYIPQEYRGQYDVGNQIFEIMTAEGVSPEQCREAQFNPETGKRCFEGTKRALSKLKELATKSPEAARMVQEIERGINQGERYMEKAREFEKSFQVQGDPGGPGGCRTSEECFRFCSNSANGAECLAFGAKHEVFSESEVAQRYGQYTQSLTIPVPVFVGPPGTSSFPGVGPYPSFRPPVGQYPGPGQYPGFTAPGPGFQPPYGDYSEPGGGPGPSPECFAAIQAGDFVKAKAICYAPPASYPYPGPYPQPYPQPQPYPYPGGDRDRMIEECLKDGKSKEECVKQVDDYLSRYQSPRPICPTVIYPPCQEGQYRPPTPNGCPSYECVADPNYRRPTICPTLPTVSGCPAGEERYVTYSSPECGEYYGCRRVSTGPTTCPSGQYWFVPPGGGAGYCRSSETGNCPTGQYWYTPPGGGAGYCKQSDYQACPSGQYWNGTTCAGSGGGCSVYNNQTSCVSASERCDWRTSGSTGWCQLSTAAASCGNYICESGETTSCPNDCPAYTPPSCPSGQYWYQPPGGGAGYCQVTTPGPQVCDSSLISLLSTGCHYMYNDASGNSIFCDSAMTKSAKRGDTATTAGCFSGGTTPPPTGQREQIWNSLGLRSWIRSDADSARIDGLKTACVNVPSGSNVWMPGAGDYASPDFGMPDPGKCRQATSCPTGQYWNGTSCVTTGDQGGTCSPYQVWYVPPGGGAGYCKPIDTQTCDSALAGLLGDSCHYMYNDASGSPIFCDGPMTKSAKRGDTTTAQGCSSGTASSCPSGQYWYAPPGGGAGYCTSSSSTTTSGSCTQELINLLGSGCHNMSSAYFNGAMDQYVLTGNTQLKSCSAEYISGCSGGTTGGAQTCPSGQYWSGTACVTSATGGTTCASGQYWNGTACVSSTSGSSSCYGGQYWDGTACSCPSGQTWSGSVCQSSVSTSCPSGQYWSGTACVNTISSDCPSGQYWNGTSCATSGTTDPAASCTAAGGTWNTSTNYCQMPGSGGFLNPQYLLANLVSILNQLTEALRGLLR